MLFSEIKFLILSSIICVSSFHPILMLTSLILLTLFLSLAFYFIYQFSIVSLMMVLIILGGMLIIFMYMISLCPNKKMNFSKKLSIIFTCMLIMMPLEMFMVKFELPHINKIYQMNFINMIIMMMIFLIMMLMIISKNLSWINAPIKKFV
uniref:NADH-ubiquinone oxidoreductase chain 6 n=1 Tax=Rhipicephalus zambeziensis TaxID=60191 RepID=A0A224Y0P5_9ACAR|nr:NADH dehydrogenase subunit 6 [Rhipicephalus zambeziensis]QLD97347.1 NADH dehydrogenase subunit 6 [Rhipicephalus zambeziensis]QLD97360.1 NADH dehydrogenase subunit 6 [Rhipicephalus zambeziensis]UYB78858.1 NADH dehydrogenase subunit 6 [Rhipicephalus zambeziensis]